MNYRKELYGVLAILDEELEKSEYVLKINTYLKKLHEEIVKYVEWDSTRCEDIVKQFEKIKTFIKDEDVLDIIELYKNKVELLRLEIKDGWRTALSNLKPYEGD